MKISKNIVRLIFGLKVNQLRQKNDMSLDVLSKESGISKSYINEIEKGKKYPQADKIISLSRALGVTYDHMVSLQLDGELAQLNDILLSDKMQVIPLTSFGLDESTLVEMMIDNPEKTQLMLSTLLSFTQYKGLTKKDFLISSSTAHKESHNNYFAHLEEHSQQCRGSFFSSFDVINSDNLINYAKKQFDIDTKLLTEEEFAAFHQIHSVYVEKKRLLLLNPKLSEVQKVFCIAKEMGNHCHKQNITRILSFPMQEYDNFEQVKNDIESTYFAKAFLAPKDSLIEDLKELFAQETFQQELFETMLAKYSISAFNLLRRMTNLWREIFAFNRFFLLAFSHERNSTKFEMNLDLNFLEQNRPETNDDDHYCRRTSARGIIINHLGNPVGSNEIRSKISKLHMAGHVLNLFTLSAIEENELEPNIVKSLTIATLTTPTVLDTVKFLNSLESTDVGYTCETCVVKNCAEREAPAILIKKELEDKELKQNISELIKNYS